MGGKWPPDGFNGPFTYDSNEWAVHGIGVLIALLLVFISLEELIAGSVEVTTYISGSAEAEVSLVGWIVLLAIGGLLSLTLLPIHERIHYYVGYLLDLNPTYGSREILGVKASVFAMTDNIEIPENALMTGSPVFVIGGLCYFIMTMTSGLVSGVVASVFLAHSAGSAQDLYHILRFILLPSGTRFRNFEDNGEIQTEYVTPASDN